MRPGSYARRSARSDRSFGGTICQSRCVSDAAGTRETIVTWPLRMAMAVSPRIFMPAGWNRWDAVALAAILAHERAHLRGQRALGLARFGFMYYLSRRFRWRVERAGYRREFRVYQRNGRVPDPERYARVLSSWFYGFMVSRREALGWCQAEIRRR